MLVASDTSPISSLAILGRLSLLHKQFGEIWIAEAVEAELKNHPDASALGSIEQAIRDGWIKRRPISNKAKVRLLESTLDSGEAETIALALELPADLILLDERDGRRAAELAGLKVTGVLGVLLRAKSQGDIPLLKPELDALRTKARFFLTRRLETQVLERAGE